MKFTVLSHFNVCMNNIYNVLLNKLLVPLTHKTVFWFAGTLTRRNLRCKDTVTENMLEKMQIIVVLGNVSVVVLVHSTNRLCGLCSEVENLLGHVRQSHWSLEVHDSGPLHVSPVSLWNISRHDTTVQRLLSLLNALVKTQIACVNLEKKCRSAGSLALDL